MIRVELQEEELRVVETYAVFLKAMLSNASRRIVAWALSEIAAHAKIRDFDYIVHTIPFIFRSPSHLFSMTASYFRIEGRGAKSRRKGEFNLGKKLSRSCRKAGVEGHSISSKSLSMAGSLKSGGERSRK